MQNTKLCFTKPEAANELTLSTRKLHELIAAGELQVIRIGRRVLIPRRALEDFLARYAAAAAWGCALKPKQISFPTVGDESRNRLGAAAGWSSLRGEDGG